MRHERRSGSAEEKETEVTLDINTPTSSASAETLLPGGVSQTLVSISLFGPRSSNSPFLGWKEEAHIRMAVCKI